jgi:hypothetical protein
LASSEVRLGVSFSAREAGKDFYCLFPFSGTTPLIATTRWFISNAFHIGMVIWVQFFGAGYGLLLGVQQSARSF